MRRLLSAMVLAITVLVAPVSLAADATFTFIDVGQGDAIWISDDADPRGMGGGELEPVADQGDHSRALAMARNLLTSR